MVSITHDKGQYAVEKKPYLFLIILAIFIFIGILIRTAWLCDDAYITLRTVDNFVNGYGLAYNISERVQTYTHPLWMFLLSGVYSITNEPYFTTIAISIIISLTALSLYAFKIAPDYISGILGILIFTFSKAYVDFSTSGLENPLSHLLLGAYFVFYLSSGLSFRKLLILSFIAALGALNRMDVIVVFAPSLAYALFKHRRLNGILALLIGFSPMILWELFSIFYYGFPFPNTAYAKLSTGIPAGRMFLQGLYYYMDSFLMDPLTLVAISIGLVLPFAIKDYKKMPIAIGVLMYLLYILKIGGDFMVGRFFTVPLFCSVVIITSYKPAPGFKKTALAFVAVVMLGLASPYPNVTSGSDYGLDRGDFELYIDAGRQQFINWGKSRFINRHGINDERGWFFQFTGLITSKDIGMQNMGGYVRGLYLKKQGPMVSIEGGAGMVGYYAGPAVHIIDELALVDPLLSKLHCKKRWSIGHFGRELPEGYLWTVSSNTLTPFITANSIEDKNLAEYYSKLRYIIRGDLFDIGRLREIWNMNTGKYDYLLARYNKQNEI